VIIEPCLGYFGKPGVDVDIAVGERLVFIPLLLADLDRFIVDTPIHDLTSAKFRPSSPGKSSEADHRREKRRTCRLANVVEKLPNLITVKPQAVS